MAGSQGPPTRSSAASPQGLLSLVGRLGEVGAVDVEDKAHAVDEATEERSAILAQAKRS